MNGKYLFLALFGVFLVFGGLQPIYAAQAAISVGSHQQRGYPVSIDGSQSTGRSPVGRTNDQFGIKHYLWEFGDGASAAGEFLNTVTHIYDKAGTYQISLTVTSYDGTTGRATANVVVGTLPNVTVSGTTGHAIQSAINVLSGPGIVNLPSGEYSVSSQITIPEGVILRGAGPSRTIIRNTSSTNQYILRAGGHNVRLTGLAVVGPGTSNYGVLNAGRRNLYIDGCDIRGFQYGVSVSGGSATFERNFIHRHIVSGSGYGIMVTNGGYAMIRNNNFAHNRHNVAANGSGSTIANTGYDFVGNHIRYDYEAAVGAEIDAHASANGRFRIVDNVFEDVSYGGQFMDGWGEIRRNTFRNVTGYIWRLGLPVRSGTTVPGAGVRHLHIDHNEIVSSTTRFWLQYGTDIYMNCRKVDHLIPISDLRLTWNDCPVPLASPKAPTGVTIE